MQCTLAGARGSPGSCVSGYTCLSRSGCPGGPCTRSQTARSRCPQPSAHLRVCTHTRAHVSPHPAPRSDAGLAGPAFPRWAAPELSSRTRSPRPQRKLLEPPRFPENAQASPARVRRASARAPRCQEVPDAPHLNWGREEDAGEPPSDFLHRNSSRASGGGGAPILMAWPALPAAGLFGKGATPRQSANRTRARSPPPRGPPDQWPRPRQEAPCSPRGAGGAAAAPPFWGTRAPTASQGGTRWPRAAARRCPPPRIPAPAPRTSAAPEPQPGIPLSQPRRPGSGFLGFRRHNNKEVSPQACGRRNALGE